MGWIYGTKRKTGFLLENGQLQGSEFDGRWLELAQDFVLRMDVAVSNTGH